IGSWQDAQLIEAGEMLPEYTRSRANGYLDWIGPAIARHPDFAKFGFMYGGRPVDDPSKWEITAYPITSFLRMEEQEEEIVERPVQEGPETIIDAEWSKEVQ